MGKRNTAEGGAATESGVVNLNTMPDPPPDGRKAMQVRKKEQLEEALGKLADGWPEGDVQELHFDPLNLSLKWKVKEIRQLDAALRGIAETLKLLDMTPRGVNSSLSASISATVVSHCTGLQTLRIGEVPFAPETIVALGGLTELRELVLGGIAVSLREPIDVSGLGSLQACHDLQTLHLDHIKLEDDALTQLVSGCSRLTDVELVSSELLTEVGVAALATACRDLRRLSLLNCEAVGPGGVRALSGCTQLQELNLQRVRGATASLSAVCGGCQGLRALYLSSSFLTDDDLAALPTLTALELLDLNAAKGYGVGVLRESLPKMGALQDLSLNGAKFPKAQMDAVVDALAATGTSTLTRLDLNNTNVTGAAVARFREARAGCKVSTINCDNAK